MDYVPSFQELATMEASLLLRKLGEHCQAVGVSLPELDKRIRTEPGFHALLFAGKIELRLQDIFAVLYVIREDPHDFFSEAIPPSKQGEHPYLQYGLRKPS
jgi:hypothetical protein